MHANKKLRRSKPKREPNQDPAEFLEEVQTLYGLAGTLPRVTMMPYPRKCTLCKGFTKYAYEHRSRHRICRGCLEKHDLARKYILPGSINLVIGSVVKIGDEKAKLTGYSQDDGYSFEVLHGQ